MNSYTIDIFKRKYPKLQSVVANIGGIIKLFLTIAQILSRFISEKMLNIELANIFSSNNDSYELIMMKENYDDLNLRKNISSKQNIIINSRMKNSKFSSFGLKSNNMEFKKLTFIQTVIPIICQK